MQAVRQQHAAAQHLGLVGMVRHALEVLRRHQRRHRGEVMVLEEVEERIAVVRVLDLVVRLGRLVGRAGAGAGARRQCRCEGDSRQRLAKEGGSAHLPVPTARA